MTATALASWQVLHRFMEEYEKENPNTVVWVRPYRHLVTVRIDDGTNTVEMRDYTWDELWKSYSQEENT
jgi:hypothetical protein